MLSQTTTNILKDLATVSENSFDQGGLYYEYHMGYRLAHCLLENDLQAAFFNTNNTEFLSLPSLGITSFEIFIENALGNYLAEKPTSHARSIAKTLIDQLKMDLTPDLIHLEVANNGHDGDADFYFARYSDNSFFSLKLSWSID